MLEQATSFPNPDDDTCRLPALLSPVSLVLQRTQLAVGLMRDVVQESSAEYWYEQGKKAITAVEWAEAAWAFGRCVNLDTKHWRGQLQLAVAFAQMRSVKPAAEALLLFYKVSHVNYLPYRDEITIKNFETFSELFENFNKNYPPCIDVLLALAFVYWITDVDAGYGELERFKPKMRETLDFTKYCFPEAVSESAIWYRLSGELWKYTGRFRVENKLQNSKALEELDKAIPLSTDNASVYVDRGNIRARLGNLLSAHMDYTYAIYISSDFASAYIQRAQCRKRMGDFNGAILDFDKAVSLAPQVAYNYALRAKVKVETFDYLGAMNDCDYAINLDSWCHAALVTRSNVKQILGDVA